MNANKTKPEKEPFLHTVYDFAEMLVLAIIVVFLLFMTTARPCRVDGASMNNTLTHNEMLLISDLFYTPRAGDIVVFHQTSELDMRFNEPIIKRVIAFPGERVTVKDGVMKIYNDEHPDGFVYDTQWRISATEGPKEHTSGEVDTIVPAGELFVSGDNREGSNSWDSRNGLGTIPYCRIIGPVMLRLFPFDKLRTF